MYKDKYINAKRRGVEGLLLNNIDFIKKIIDKSVYSYPGNLDDISMSGVVKITDATIGIPSGLTSQIGSYCITFYFDANAERQIYLRKHTNDIYLRYKSSGQWSEWVLK